MSKWRWEVKLIDGPTIEIIASDVELSNGGYFDFTTEEAITVRRSRTVRKGIWPFTSTSEVVEDRNEIQSSWVTTIRASHVLQITPLAPVAASGIEAPSADKTTQIGSTEGESPAPQEDAQ